LGSFGSVSNIQDLVSSSNKLIADEEEMVKIRRL